MEEKRGIKIYDFSNKEDRESVLTIFSSLARTRTLVPIIGAGFTQGMRTRDGIVPSADELKSEMISIICSIDHSSVSDFNNIKLPDLADIFWETLENTSKIRYKERFQEYIELNFTKVYDVEQSRRHFLNSNWLTIYTLNFDDTIENVLDINVVVPYDGFHNREGKNYLIKLHGDAKRYEITGDSKYCVLSNQQYIRLIKDSKNKDLVDHLEGTFFSKSLIFVGCSLQYELDLLYSAGTQLEQKTKLNREHHIIYLLYSEKDEEVNPIPYKKYGITDIIKVNSETINELYESIYDISQKEEVLREKDLLKEYTDIRFEYLDKRNDDNLDYLFYSDKINIKDHVIKLPAFFVERECGKEIEAAISAGEGIFSIIYGTNFSGKTYVLIQLLKTLINKKVYYFPSYITLNDDVLASLAEKENAVVLIDDKVISFEQYKKVLIPLIDQFEEKKIKLVMAVNKGDVEFYRYYKNHKGIEEEKIKLYELENKFVGEELREFNKKIGDISLIPYKENDTILDFLFRADEGLLERKHRSILPRVNFLSYDNEKKVRALIILTTKGAMTSQDATALGIDDILYELVNDFSITVQKDYLSDLEQKNDAYSGFKFILNSTYWAIKCLSKFANNPHSHQTIVNAYRNIVSSYSGLDQNVMNNRIKAYYMLDKIQLLFSSQDNKGTIRLPYVVYEGLHDSLSWNYQFLHQEAMCELRMARREKNSDNKKRILKLSYRNIVRARKLTEEVVSDKIEYTRAHMDVTKALILINYVFSGEQGQIRNTICACYDAFVTGGPLCSQLKKDEMKDVKKFLESNWAEWLEEDGDAIDKFNELYSEYSRKPSWVLNVV